MAKYPNWTGRIEALLNVLGGEKVADALIAGIKVAEIKDVVRMFFDKHGRRIPLPGMKSSVCDANRNFRLEQPTVDFTERLFRLHVALGLTKPCFIQPEEFEQRTAEIVRRLKGDKLLANLFCGVYLPIALPQMQVADYGAALDETILPVVGHSYEVRYPGRKFYNNRQGTLAGEVSVVEGSRHEALIAALAAGPVVALYFPTALQGFSIAADLEQMDTLPEHILLAGALELSAAEIMYPDVVARDYYTPGLDCAAVRWQEYSLCFEAFDVKLNFFNGDLNANDRCSGGLVVLG